MSVKILSRLSQKLNLDHVSLVIAKAASIAFVIQALGTILKYVMNVFFANWMSVENYGYYSYAFTWAQVITVLASLGLSLGALKFIPQYITNHQLKLVHGYLRSSLIIILLSGLSFAFVGIATFYKINSPQVDLRSIYWGMLLIPVLGVMDLGKETIRSTRKIAYAYTPPLIIYPILSILLSYFAYLYYGMLSAVMVIYATGISIVITIFIQRASLKWVILPRAYKEKPQYDISTWIKVSLPLFLIVSFQMLINQTNTLLVGSLLGPRDISIYYAASKTSNLGSFVLLAVNAIIAPMITSTYTKGNKQDLQRLVNTVAPMLFWPSLFVAVGFLLFGKLVLGFFGNEFEAGYWILQILAFGQLINSSVGPVGFLLGLTGYEKQSAKIYGISALLNIAISYFAITYAGLLGAAFSQAFIIILWELWLLISVKKELGIDPSFFYTLRRRRKISDKQAK